MHSRKRRLEGGSVLLLVAALAAGDAAAAADGDLDPSFWSDGSMFFSSVYDGNFHVGSVLAAPDGRLVVTASRQRSSAPDALFWQRLTSTGFSTLCNFEPPGGATAVYDLWGAVGTFDVGGRLLVAGSVEYGTNNRIIAVARFLYPNCTPDPSFDGDGYATFDLMSPPIQEFATAIDTDALGRVYVAGAKGLADVDQDMLLMRLQLDGDLDPTFSGNGWLVLDSLGVVRKDYAHGLAVQATGGMPVMAGIAEVDASGNLDFVAARFTLAGALDTTFSGDGVAQIAFDLGGAYDAAFDVAFDLGSGRLAVVGSADSATTRRAAVAVLTPSGALDPTFSGDGKTTFLFEGADNSALIDSVWDGLGRLVTTGLAYDGPSGPADFGVARLLPGGALDTDFGPAGSVTVPFDVPGSTLHDIASAITLQYGKPLVAGYVRHPDALFRPALVRLETALIFADGFDTGTVLAWPGWY